MIARLLLTAAAFAPHAAEAQLRKEFEVAAAVVTGCSVALDAGGAWGRIDLGAVAGTATSVIEAGLISVGGAGLRVDCTPGTTAILSADAGEHGVGGTRRLGHDGGSGAAVPYELFADDGAAPWRDQPLPLSFPAGVQRRSVPIRARAVLPGALPAGRYADMVRVTLTW